VVLTSESVDEILWCDHSNETSSAVRSHGTMCLVGFEKMKFRIFLEFVLWPLLGLKGLIVFVSPVNRFMVEALRQKNNCQ